jgi:hypothetical protein
MTRRDGFSDFNFLQNIQSEALAATTTGTTIDTQGYNTTTFVLNLGRCSHVSTLSYWVWRVQHTDASALGLGASDFANVASADVIREASGAVTSGIVQQIIAQTVATVSTQGSTKHIVGYVGSARYVRTILELVSTASILNAAVDVVQGLPSISPVNTPNVG